MLNSRHNKNIKMSSNGWQEWQLCCVMDTIRIDWITVHPSAYCCDLCRSISTVNVAVGRMILNHVVNHRRSPTAHPPPVWRGNWHFAMVSSTLSMTSHHRTYLEHCNWRGIYSFILSVQWQSMPITHSSSTLCALVLVFHICMNILQLLVELCGMCRRIYCT